MKLHLKGYLKRILVSRGYHLSWTSDQTVGGTVLPRDLRILIGNRGPVCLDVGANEGQTLEMLTSALDGPTIHAFEPAPNQFRLLEQHWKRANIHLHPFAIGSQDCSMDLNLYDLPVLNSLLHLNVESNDALPVVQQLGTQSVRLVTLDAFAGSHHLKRIDLLKIDTQGFDFEVLKGATSLFAEGRIRHVLVELNYIPLYSGQCSPLEIENFLTAHGFRLVDLYEKVRTHTAIDWCTALFQHTTK